MSKRKKITVKANELTEVGISAISLVKHGANRSPFKILKSNKDGNMHLNLKTLFSKKEKTDEPRVLLVVVPTAKAEAVSAALKNEGQDVVKTEDLEGATTLHLVDEDNENTLIFKMSDDLAIGVTGISKSFNSWPEGKNFVQDMSASGFYPGARLATDVFMDTLHTVMYKAEAGKVPVAKIAKLTEDFSGYIQKLTGELPVEAFKFEKADFTNLPDTIVEDGDAETVVKEDGTDKALESDTDIVKDDDKGTVAKKDDTEVDADTEVSKTTDESTLAKSDVESIVTEKMETVKSAVDTAITAHVKKQEDATKGLVGQIEKLTKLVKGVVSFDDSEDPDGVIEKAEPASSDFDDVIKFEGFGETDN